jgi:peptide deformylase
MKLFYLICFLLISLPSFAERLPIIQLGHPTLRATAQEIDLKALGNPEFQKLIDDMIQTMGEAGGVGLAAPQVNHSLRMFVMKSWPGVPLTVVINPILRYDEAAGLKDSTEGCLSIPGRSLKVKRYKKIHLSYYDRRGRYITQDLSGFGAIIAQHEYDHLNGVLIVDLIEELLGELNFEAYFQAPLM